MRLSTYIQRTRALGDAKIPAHVIDQLAERIEQGADLAELLKKRSATLTPRILLGIWRAQRRQVAHLEHLEAVARERREAGLTAIVPSLLKQTLAAHEVVVLLRAEEMAPAGRAAEHRRRDAIKEAITLFNACIALTRRDGVLVAEATDPESPAAALAGEHPMGELKGDEWRQLRRAEAAGALTLTIRPPVDRFLAKLNSRGAELSAITSGRSAQEFLDVLIMPDVSDWAAQLKDEEASFLAIRAASAVWFELLSAPRPAQALFAGIWIPASGPLGVVVVTRDGRLLEQAEVASDGELIAPIEAAIGAHPIEALIVATEDADEPRLATLREGFGSFEVIEANTLALHVGAEAMADEATGAALLALVAARRTVRPLKYWGQADPEQIPLVDGQADLDGLAETLADIRALAFAGIKPSDLAPSEPKTPSKRAPAKPLNPMVKSVDDLRPGLEVNGIVTNITQFGAFVNIGLSHEGLVHVSELADHFVNDPKEVVQVNQQVQARVLGVDRARRRISLSLRPDRSAPVAARPTADRGDEAHGGRGDKVRLDDIPGTRGERRRSIANDRTRGQATGASRAQALADLEALFKKK